MQPNQREFGTDITADIPFPQSQNIPNPIRQSGEHPQAMGSACRIPQPSIINSATRNMNNQFRNVENQENIACKVNTLNTLGDENGHKNFQGHS
jgi:hypothetical protein